ncbi:hypothetical protein ECN1_1951 [Escherichia coli N1]|nr:hypothetical protein ECN1_1951 [Escherichia coli N1]
MKFCAGATFITGFNGSGYSETNFAVRFRVVCLLLTTSGEVVSLKSPQF